MFNLLSLPFRMFFGMFNIYRVVPVNEAHVRIMNKRKEIFSSRTGNMSYWYIPFITNINKLPLCNLTIPVNDIKLNDKNMAKFVCDLCCFINIKDIDLAVERLSITGSEYELGFDFVKLSEDLKAIMESIGRTVTTKQTILDIYMNRQLLDEAITKEVQAVFPRWGIELVDLELKDIKDVNGSTILQDIEKKVAAEISRDAQIKIAETQADAALKVAESTKRAEVAKAEAEETYRLRQVERDKKIADGQKEANLAAISATRELAVGQASIEKEKIEQNALAQKIRSNLESEGLAASIRNSGQAEADIIRIKKEAEAAGTLKLAEALKQFDDKAFAVKKLEITKEIMVSKFNSLSSAISKADIKWILSGENAQKFFGINLDAEGGANAEQFFKESGLNLKEIIEKAKS